MSENQENKLYFIRHGETNWNRQSIFMGWEDIPLNETGLAQAQAAAKTLEDVPLDFIAASPLLRAKKTADIIAQSKGLPVYTFDGFKEYNWGIMQGCVVAEEEILALWDGGPVCQNAETIKEFIARVTRDFIKVKNTLSGNGLIVAHGGVLRCLQHHHGWPLTNPHNCEMVKL